MIKRKCENEQTLSFVAKMPEKIFISPDIEEKIDNPFNRLERTQQGRYRTKCCHDAVIVEGYRIVCRKCHKNIGELKRFFIPIAWKW